MKTIYDVGMYDASDTIYYLEEGFKVVAVEANPALVRRAQVLLEKYVTSGQLDIVNAAVGSSNEAIELTVCGDNLGASSIYEESVKATTAIGKFTVPGITTQELIDRFGIPYYLKIDIEGADALCVRALCARTRPIYLSFEIGDGLEELVAHIASIGFRKFKIINQCDFREASNQNNLRDRVARKIIRLLGYTEPQYVERGRRYFKLGISSGPAPWCSDGNWRSQQEVIRKWSEVNALEKGNVWYDLHCM